MRESKYKEVRGLDLHRATIPTLYNNPTKAMSFLVTELYPSTTWKIRQAIYKECFGVDGSPRRQPGMLKEKGIRPISFLLPSSYYDTCILGFSHFARKKKLEYSKTLDGAAIGDLVAYKCIESSSDPRLISSNYLIFGIATTLGETDAQVTTSLLLFYLDRNKVYAGSKPKPAHEIIEGIFEFEGRRTDSEYIRLIRRISVHNLSRLQRAGLVNYETRRRKESNKYAPKTRSIGVLKKEEITQKLREKYARATIAFKRHLPNVFKFLLKNPDSGLEEIAEKLGLSKRVVGEAVSMLRYLDLVEITKGRPQEECLVTTLTERGKHFVEEHLAPLYDVLGILDPLEEELTYSSLQRKIKPDLEGIYEERKENLDPIIEDREKSYEFREKCVEARLRHQKESGHIQERVKF